MNERASNRWRAAILYAACWSPFAAISVAATFVSPNAATGAATRALAETALAALVGAPVWLLSGRLESVTRRRAIVAYAVTAIPFALALSIGSQFVSTAFWPDATMGRVPRLEPVQLVAGGLFYIFLLVAIIAARNAMRAERSRRAAATAEQARLVAESARARAELQGLRAHLDPHFLFNTLNAIAAVVETDPAMARQLLVRTGSLLRRVLDLGASGRDTASVADEMAMVSEYLAFERLRMGDRLQVDSAFSDAALECEIPAFMLQPLVENAIRHGLFPQPSGGTLRISGDVAGDTLTLVVADTGGGALLESVNKATGFGLRATRQRVQGIYNGAARIEVETAPGSGFSVRLVLPAEVPVTPAVASPANA